jgi:hypothetical protein
VALLEVIGSNRKSSFGIQRPNSTQIVTRAADGSVADGFAIDHRARSLRQADAQKINGFSRC